MTTYPTMTAPELEAVEAVARAIMQADQGDSPAGHFPDGSAMRNPTWDWFDAQQHAEWRKQAQAAAAALTALGWRKVGEGDVVDFYEREFYPLSNFSSFRLNWRDRWFDTSEAAYHWEKFPGIPDIQGAIRLAQSAHEAFKVAEANKGSRRSDWDQIKFDIMAAIIRAKADQHEYVRRKLMETGDRLLVEGSWRDDVWGIGPNGDGQNMLGKLWMAERDRRRVMIAALDTEER